MKSSVRAMSVRDLKAALLAEGMPPQTLATFVEKKEFQDRLISKWQQNMINDMACGRGLGGPEAIREQLQTFQQPSDVPASERIPDLPDDVVLGIYCAYPAGDVPISAATLEALNAIVSGAPSPPEVRARWPRSAAGGRTRSPACASSTGATLRFLAFAFSSPRDAMLWVWKVNYQIFAGEGALLIHTQNLPPEYHGFRITTTLHYIMNYVSGGKLVFADGAWRLDGREQKPRYEPGRGAHSFAMVLRSSHRRRPRHLHDTGASTCREASNTDGRTSGSSSAPSSVDDGRSSTVTAGLEGVSGGDGGSSRGTATGPGEISHVATL